MIKLLASSNSSNCNVLNITDWLDTAMLFFWVGWRRFLERPAPSIWRDGRAKCRGFGGTVITSYCIAFIGRAASADRSRVTQESLLFYLAPKRSAQRSLQETKEATQCDFFEFKLKIVYGNYPDRFWSKWIRFSFMKFILIIIGKNQARSEGAWKISTKTVAACIEFFQSFPFRSGLPGSLLVPCSAR